MQLLKTSSAVLEPLIPNLSNFGETEKPGKFISIINAVIQLFFFPESSFVLALRSSSSFSDKIFLSKKKDVIYYNWLFNLDLSRFVWSIIKFKL